MRSLGELIYLFPPLRPTCRRPSLANRPTHCYVLLLPSSAALRILVHFLPSPSTRRFSSVPLPRSAAFRFTLCISFPLLLSLSSFPPLLSPSCPFHSFPHLLCTSYLLPTLSPLLPLLLLGSILFLLFLSLTLVFFLLLLLLLYLFLVVPLLLLPTPFAPPPRPTSYENFQPAEAI